MADRHGAPSSRPGAKPSTSTFTSSRTGAGGPATGSTSTSTNSVRRNLFQSQLTRRPTVGTSSSGTSTSTSTETLRLENIPAQQQSPEPSGPGSSDIVIRDKNGDIDLLDPPTPPVDDPDEIALDTRQENEKERQRLAEAVKQHQIDQNSVPTQPEELLEAVRASLRAKVAALAEDNWMFEREELPKLQ
ncbi:hypothetical protein B0H66DRAFT_548275 [Apodospora peruviana]|uniref:Uncharacterized protein n=1 Tax=Apodospora peruviana TaxID=516989 RepID=A0AAE0IIL7_9PEZI|nr:hypothetical protein B0H66DRAFT_548275 [Apodospora peruviana]